MFVCVRKREKRITTNHQSPQKTENPSGNYTFFIFMNNIVLIRSALRVFFSSCVKDF